MMERSEAKLRTSVAKWRAKAFEERENAKEYRKRLQEMEENYNEMKECSEGWSEAYNDVFAILRRFNEMPWYKKMFYRFNV